MIRVFRTGQHALYMPVSHPDLAPLFAEDIQFVDSPAAADLYLFSHVLDVEHAPQEMVEDWRVRQRPVVVLSEEPFWDTIWGTRPLAPVIYVDTRFGPLPVHQISHQTSDVFRFSRIPYFLLTDRRYALMYQRLFARNAERSPADWLQDWRARRLDLAFMFERRPEAKHDVAWPEADLLGLNGWRTHFAEACTGAVVRLGRSWQGGGAPRQTLEDWHGAKIRQLDGLARMMGAVENTHQPDYITEKVFDAFACGSVPLYVASPMHRIHELGLPSDSWLNLYGHTPADAATICADYRLNADIAAAYAAAQRKLAVLLGNDGIWRQETAQLKLRILTALAATID